MADDVQDAPADAVTTDPVETKADVKAETASLLTDTNDKPAAAPADFPEDWRVKLAGGDEKELKRLERFKSVADVYKSYRAQEAKMSGVKQALEADATPEQVAAWRKDNGIPEKPEGYLEKLPGGLVIGDDDKPMAESFLAAMHGKNVAPDVVSEALAWYYKSQEDAAAAQAQSDKEFRAKAEDALRGEWGGEYRGNINSIMSFLDSAPPTEDGTPMKDLLMGARLADGTAFGDNPAALKWLARLASDANPAGFVSPGAGGSQAQSVAAEIETIKARMRNDRAGYDKDQAMQDRFLKLLEAQEKLSTRAA